MFEINKYYTCVHASIYSVVTHQTEAVPQTDSQRVQVTKQYPAKLFLVTEMYTAVDRTDISVCSGDVVGVIKENDPYNNSKRWLVDNGGT